MEIISTNGKGEERVVLIQDVCLGSERQQMKLTDGRFRTKAGASCVV